MSEATRGTEVADSEVQQTSHTHRRFKDELRRERASEGGTEGGVCDRDDSNPLDEPDARVDWSDLPDGILHRVFQLLFQEKDGHQIVGTCGQVCRGWHDDAWDVLMQDTAATRRPVPGVAPEDNDEAEGGEGMMNGDAKKEDSTVRARRETSDASSMDEDIVSKRRKLPDESEAVSAPSGGGGGGGVGDEPDGYDDDGSELFVGAGPFPRPNAADAANTTGAPAEQVGSGAQDSAHCQHSDGSVLHAGDGAAARQQTPTSLARGRAGEPDE